MHFVTITSQSSDEMCRTTLCYGGLLPLLDKLQG
jgi:hypothetical protein